MKRRILCIDGGGIRGIIPAMICVEIEKVTGKKINEIFDLISGTSTGTILGAGLSLGIPAQELLNMYMHHGEEIFTERVRWYKPWEYITKPKYFKYYITKYMNSLYGRNTKITDIKDTKFMCVAYEATNKKYEFFTSWQERYTLTKLIDAVTYSMSAITYFGKTVDDENKKVYTDGAMELYNSTPLMAAIEAPKLGWGDDDNYILNLGCGANEETVLDFDDVKEWNNIDQIFKIYLANSIEQINRLKNSAINSDITPSVSMEQINPILPSGLKSLDDVSNSDELLDIAIESAKKVVNLEILK